MIWIRRSLFGLFILVLLALTGLYATRLFLQHQASASRPVIDKSRGVDELFYATVGGIPQAFHARGLRRDAPLLLYLHGGPGTPMMPFSPSFQSPWESHFIVVQWDQRLSGKTYFASDASKLLANTDMARMKQDTVEAIELLLQRYDKRKLVLLGHSWGTMLADPVSRARPDLVAAYVGTGVVTDVYQNEVLSFAKTLELAKIEGRNDLAAKLEKLQPYPTTPGKITKEDEPGADVLRQVELDLGVGMTRRYRGDVDTLLFRLALSSPEYSLRDVNYFRLDPALTYAPKLQLDIMTYDARKNAGPLLVPTLFILGRWDYQTMSSLSERYFNELPAPVKRLVWLEDSAHSPMVDEPGAFAAALVQNLSVMLPEGVP